LTRDDLKRIVWLPMSLRSPRVVLLTFVAGFAAVALLVAGAASPVGAIAHVELKRRFLIAA
jgi:hypothetical protein